MAAATAMPQTQTSTPTKPPTNQMLPGMIMGPDGKPCKICTAFRNWRPGTTKPDLHRNNEWSNTKESGSQMQRQKETTKASMAGIAGVMAALAAGTATKDSNLKPPFSKEPAKNEVPEHTELTYRGNEVPPGCPPDVEVLGRATWTFLHTAAAYYPEKPTPTQRANMLMLLRSLPIVYPCSWCAQDFGKSIDRHSPDVSGRVALSRWLCERHNDVNVKLGKDKFDCAKVDERWKDGPPDGSCD